MQDPTMDPCFQRLRRNYAEQHYGAPKRKRGGQPGNRNARKRGIVDRPLTPEQRNTLRAVQRAGVLSPQINFLRIRFAALLSDPCAEPEVLLCTARLLARMLRTELRARDARRGMN